MNRVSEYFNQFYHTDFTLFIANFSELSMLFIIIDDNEFFVLQIVYYRMELMRALSHVCYGEEFYDNFFDVYLKSNYSRDDGNLTAKYLEEVRIYLFKK